VEGAEDEARSVDEDQVQRAAGDDRGLDLRQDVGVGGQGWLLPCDVETGMMIAGRRPVSNVATGCGDYCGAAGY